VPTSEIIGEGNRWLLNYGLLRVNLQTDLPATAATEWLTQRLGRPQSDESRSRRPREDQAAFNVQSSRPVPSTRAGPTVFKDVARSDAGSRWGKAILAGFDGFFDHPAKPAKSAMFTIGEAGPAAHASNPRTRRSTSRSVVDFIASRKRGRVCFVATPKWARTCTAPMERSNNSAVIWPGRRENRWPVGGREVEDGGLDVPNEFAAVEDQRRPGSFSPAMPAGLGVRNIITDVPLGRRGDAGGRSG